MHLYLTLNTTKILIIFQNSFDLLITLEFLTNKVCLILLLIIWVVLFIVLYVCVSCYEHCNYVLCFIYFTILSVLEHARKAGCQSRLHGQAESKCPHYTREKVSLYLYLYMWKGHQLRIVWIIKNSLHSNNIWYTCTIGNYIFVCIMKHNLHSKSEILWNFIVHFCPQIVSFHILHFVCITWDGHQLCFCLDYDLQIYVYNVLMFIYAPFMPGTSVMFKM